MALGQGLAFWVCPIVTPSRNCNKSSHTHILTWNMIALCSAHLQLYLA